MLEVPLSIHVRLATPDDLNACLQLDSSFETERVWQLDLREGRSQIAANLRMATLPRRLRVAYPTPDDTLLMHWQRGYCLLVAEDLATGAVLGYADVGPEPDLQLGWLWHLVVARGRRRQGVGSALLAGAAHWGAEHGLRRLMAPLQAQNDPGIRFCQRHGFVFCGFNDRYYRTGSVALFFERSLV